jgi:hypothetical protein
MALEGQHIYYHSPCFDGIVSAVLVMDYLENTRKWHDIRLHPVNYHLRSTWLETALQRPCGVVDFLYHPDADFWADHHMTTFLTDDVKEQYERRKDRSLIYDSSAGSCAGLLRRHLYDYLSGRRELYEDLVPWAEKTDAARYDSVNEAIFPSAPALRINASLAWHADDEYCNTLVRLLAERPVDEVADLRFVRERYEQLRELTSAGLARFKKVSWLESDGIAVFDVSSAGVFVNRYSPYYFFPDARYSAGIIRWEDGAKVTAMRNPWRDFPSVPLGKICESLGGGGHQRVGSIMLNGERAREATVLLNRLTAGIRKHEQTDRVGAAV